MRPLTPVPPAFSPPVSPGTGALDAGIACGGSVSPAMFAGLTGGASRALGALGATGARDGARDAAADPLGASGGMRRGVDAEHR